MIHSAHQLKALVRNRSNSDSKKAQTLIRIYTMEKVCRIVMIEFANLVKCKPATAQIAQ